MSISNLNPNIKEVVLFQRDNTNSQYNEVHISGSLIIPFLNSLGDIDFDTSGSFYADFPPPSAPSVSSVWQVYTDDFYNPNGFLIPSNSYDAARYYKRQSSSSLWGWSINNQIWESLCPCACPLPTAICNMSATYEVCNSPPCPQSCSICCTALDALAVGDLTAWADIVLNECLGLSIPPPIQFIFNGKTFTTEITTYSPGGVTYLGFYYYDIIRTA